MNKKSAAKKGGKTRPSIRKALKSAAKKLKK